MRRSSFCSLALGAALAATAACSQIAGLEDHELDTRAKAGAGGAASGGSGAAGQPGGAAGFSGQQSGGAGSSSEQGGASGSSGQEGGAGSGGEPGGGGGSSGQQSGGAGSSGQQGGEGGSSGQQGGEGGAAGESAGGSGGSSGASGAGAATGSPCGTPPALKAGHIYVCIQYAGSGSGALVIQVRAEDNMPPKMPDVGQLAAVPTFPHFAALPPNNMTPLAPNTYKLLAFIDANSSGAVDPSDPAGAVAGIVISPEDTVGPYYVLTLSP